MPLREKCPNTWLFLVRIFLYSDTFHAVAVWRNNNRLFSKDTSSASECIPVYDTCNNSPINTESSSNSNSNDAISDGTCKTYYNGENYLFSFLIEEIKF